MRKKVHGTTPTAGRYERDDTIAVIALLGTLKSN